MDWVCPQATDVLDCIDDPKSCMGICPDGHAEIVRRTLIANSFYYCSNRAQRPKRGRIFVVYGDGKWEGGFRDWTSGRRNEGDREARKAYMKQISQFPQYCQQFSLLIGSAQPCDIPDFPFGHEQKSHDRTCTIMALYQDLRSFSDFAKKANIFSKAPPGGRNVR